MKIEFDTVEAWKSTIQNLLEHNVDIATGTVEDMFIIVYDYHDAIRKMFII